MKRTTFITRTALMIALALVAQSLRFIIPTAPTLLIGTLVNLVLVVSAGIVGGAGAAIVSVIAPIVAFFQGGPAAASAVFIPCIAAGNLALVLMFAWLSKKNSILGGALGSVAKFGVLYVLMVVLAIPAFAPAKLVAPLSAAFGITQLATAAMGSALGIIVLLLLKRAGIGKDKSMKE